MALRREAAQVETRAAARRYNPIMHPVLRTTAHRPWPVPNRSWLMQQFWNDLLFMHWPLPPSEVRPLVPAQLTLHTFEEQAWVAVVPFWMSGIRQRFLPPFPGTSSFPELNVRTYVTYNGKPGVYFFSLDATNRLAVWGARMFFHLPYFHANMRAETRAGQTVYECQRVRNGAAYRGRYRPIGDVRFPVRGTLEHFLTERYRLYTVVNDRVFRSDIHHAPWPLQDASADVAINTMATAAGIMLPSVAPLLHFSKRQVVLVWSLENA